MGLRRLNRTVIQERRRGGGKSKSGVGLHKGKNCLGKGEVVRSWVNAFRRTGEGGGLSSVRVVVGGEGANRGMG